MHNNFLAFFGHVVMDVTMHVNFLPTHGSVGINNMEDNYGGTAGNFAMVASSIGVPFDLFSSVSRRTHADYLSFLAGKGIDLSHVYIDEEKMGPIGYAVTTAEDQIYYFYQGPMEDSLYDKVKQTTLDYRYIHFATGLPSDYLRFAEHGINSRIVFDPGQELAYRYDRDQLSKFLDMAHLTILNESEEELAASMLGIDASGLSARCRNLIVTRGKEGSEYMSDGETLRFGALNLGTPHSTIGAGDTFRAGLYFALYKGMAMEDAIIMGTITAGLAIQKPIRDFSADQEKLMALYNEYRDTIILK